MSLKMSIGTSGRLVIEIEPELKQEIYASLKAKGLTLKEWFLLKSEELVNNNNKEDNEVKSK